MDNRLNFESAIEETNKMSHPFKVHRRPISQQVTDYRRRQNPRLHATGVSEFEGTMNLLERDDVHAVTEEKLFQLLGAKPTNIPENVLKKDSDCEKFFFFQNE